MKIQPAAPGNIIMTASLACGAYLPGRLGAGMTAHVHAAEIRLDRQGDEVVRVLCRKVKPASVLPDASQYGAEPATCPECVRRLALLGIDGLGHWPGA